MLALPTLVPCGICRAGTFLKKTSGVTPFLACCMLQASSNSSMAELGDETIRDISCRTIAQGPTFEHVRLVAVLHVCGQCVLGAAVSPVFLSKIITGDHFLNQLCLESMQLMSWFESLKNCK